MIAPSAADRARIVALARSWIGTPYHHQASVRGIGADCLGLVRGVWREFYGHEPELPPAYSPDWAEATRCETLLGAARRHLAERDRDAGRPGDLVLFRFRAYLPAKHAGIMVGAASMVHAYEGSGVVEAKLVPWWRRRIAGVFAFPGRAM